VNHLFVSDNKEGRGFRGRSAISFDGERIGVDTPKIRRKRADEDPSPINKLKVSFLVGSLLYVEMEPKRNSSHALIHPFELKRRWGTPPRKKG